MTDKNARVLSFKTRAGFLLTAVGVVAGILSRAAGIVTGGLILTRRCAAVTRGGAVVCGSGIGILRREIRHAGTGVYGVDSYGVDGALLHRTGDGETSSVRRPMSILCVRRAANHVYAGCV